MWCGVRGVVCVSLQTNAIAIYIFPEERCCHLKTLIECLGNSGFYGQWIARIFEDTCNIFMADTRVGTSLPCDKKCLQYMNQRSIAARSSTRIRVASAMSSCLSCKRNW